MTQGQTTLPTPKRADALDALRGLAILAMVFSGTIRYKILPAWMYHAQLPPPNHAFNKNLPGLTWVDVVFPLFLFAMGAAIPLALSRRLSQGWSLPQVILHIGKRGILLAAFAIVLQHLRPGSINPNLSPNSPVWFAALLGFVLLWLMFADWSRVGKLGKYGNILTVGGWVGAVIVISQFHYGGEGFSLNRSDPILMALANMAVFGSLAWLFTRDNWLLRLGLLGLLTGLQFSADADGWVKWLWNASPTPWLFKFLYLKYLYIVIPGTMAGDVLLTPSPSPFPVSEEGGEERLHQGWYRLLLGMIVVSVLVICLVLLVGLQGRWIWQTTVVSAGVCGASWLLFRKLVGDHGDVLQRFYQWGVYWLALGLCWEPFGGGIKKDPSTYSFYFVTVAIAFFLLITFMILLDILHQQKWLWILIDNGKNPMIAYVAFANFLWAVLNITGLEDWVIANTGTPITGVIKGIAYTLAIALFTSLCTRLKLFWKA